MKNKILSITLVAVLLFAACSKKSNPGHSKRHKVIPTNYTVDILPLIQLKCSPCHTPSKGGNKANFENYTIAVKSAADILIRIQLTPGVRGFMPFKHDKLTEEEIGVFKKWVADGLLEK